MSGSFVIANSGEGVKILSPALLVSLCTGESHHINKNDGDIFL